MQQSSQAQKKKTDKYDTPTFFDINQHVMEIQIHIDKIKDGYAKETHKLKKQLAETCKKNKLLQKSLQENIELHDPSTCIKVINTNGWSINDVLAYKNKLNTLTSLVDARMDQMLNKKIATATCCVCSKFYDKEYYKSVLIPCGHVFCNACTEAAISFGSCYECRLPISKSIKIYL